VRRLIMYQETPIHLVMRFSDKLVRTDTIRAHREVIGKHKAVWIGKIGKTLARGKVDRLNSQCENGVPTYLYLVTRIAGSYKTFRGAVNQVSRSFPKRELKMVPKYYHSHELIAHMRLWVKISSLESVNEKALQQMCVSNSGMRVDKTLPVSMAAMFIVRDI
jgi:hypothetical protein